MNEISYKALLKRQARERRACLEPILVGLKGRCIEELPGNPWLFRASHRQTVIVRAVLMPDPMSGPLEVVVELASLKNPRSTWRRHAVVEPDWLEMLIDQEEET